MSRPCFHFYIFARLLKVFKLTFKLADQPREWLEFIAKNPAKPAIHLDYLQKNQTFLLYHREQLIGGFVYALNQPLRSLELIKSPLLRARCYQNFEGQKVAEITCLWLDPGYRKSLYSKLLWLSIAIQTFSGEADYYLFVSKSAGLIKAMNYPACTSNFLTCEECLPGSETVLGSFFLAERKNTLIGMLQGVYYFNFKPRQKPQKQHDLARFSLEPEGDLALTAPGIPST